MLNRRRVTLLTPNMEFTITNNVNMSIKSLVIVQLYRPPRTLDKYIIQIQFYDKPWDLSELPVTF